MIAFLEHHGMWHTLAALLRHTDAAGVVVRFKGTQLGPGQLTAECLQVRVLKGIGLFSSPCAP